MFKGKIRGISSIFSILVSSAGLITLRKTFLESEEVEQELNNFINAPIADKAYPFLTVLVPARNEERNIGQCLTSILSQDYPNFEVVAIDDSSSDSTPRIIQELLALYPKRLKVQKANPPAKDWLGKPNALWQGYQVANPQAEWILFVDADVKLQPGILRSAVEYARNKKLDLLSMVPGLEQEGVSFWHKLLFSEISKFYTLAHLNPLQPAKKGSVEEASAIGTFILARKEAYEEVGGHTKVRNSLIEDIMLARSFREKGFSTAQVIGINFLQTKGYANFSEIWEGVTKNLFTVAHKNWLIVAFIVGVELIYGILPFVNFVRVLTNRQRNQLYKKPSFVFNIFSIFLLVYSSYLLNRQFKISCYYALLYPFTGIIASMMLIASAVKTQFLKKVAWKGREINL